MSPVSLAPLVPAQPDPPGPGHALAALLACRRGAREEAAAKRSGGLPAASRGACSASGAAAETRVGAMELGMDMLFEEGGSSVGGEDEKLLGAGLVAGEPPAPVDGEGALDDAPGVGVGIPGAAYGADAVRGGDEGAGAPQKVRSDAICPLAPIHSPVCTSRSSTRAVRPQGARFRRPLASLGIYRTHGPCAVAPCRRKRHLGAPEGAPRGTPVPPRFTVSSGSLCCGAAECALPALCGYATRRAVPNLHGVTAPVWRPRAARCRQRGGTRGERGGKRVCDTHAGGVSGLLERAARSDARSYGVRAGAREP